MARPRTPIGTFGDIDFTTLGPDWVRARTRVRDFDGQVRRVEATASSRKLAEHRLKEKPAQRATRAGGSRQLTPDSSFKELVEVQLADLDLESGLAPSTRALYERNMRQLVMPAFEHYTLREVTIGRIEPFLKSLAANKSYSYPKQAKTVLNLALGLAAQRPVEDLADVGGEVEGHLLAHGVGHVVEVALVAGREYDLGSRRPRGLAVQISEADIVALNSEAVGPAFAPRTSRGRG